MSKRALVGLFRRPAILLLPLALSACFSAESGQAPQGRNYLDSLRPFWQNLYPQGGETLYCGKRFRPFDRSVNVEHVYPMSWVTKQLGCGKREQCRRNSPRFNLIESDMHNLFPALKEINQARGSMPYAIIPGEDHFRTGCDFEVDFRKRVVEPRPEARGRIARAMLYMADTYGLTLYKRQRQLLEKWHRQYPPDAAEKRHNRQVAKLQGKPNPYVR